MQGCSDDIPLPTLSGVLADFLKQLVRMDVSGRRQDKKGDLAVSLERQILKGARSIVKESEAGYPMFSYQPQGLDGRPAFDEFVVYGI